MKNEVENVLYLLYMPLLYKQTCSDFQLSLNVFVDLQHLMLVRVPLLEEQHLDLVHCAIMAWALVMKVEQLIVPCKCSSLVITCL